MGCSKFTIPDIEQTRCRISSKGLWEHADKETEVIEVVELEGEHPPTDKKSRTKLDKNGEFRAGLGKNAKNSKSAVQGTASQCLGNQYLKM